MQVGLRVYIECWKPCACILHNHDGRINILLLMGEKLKTIDSNMLAGGVLHDAMLPKQSPTTLRLVSAPKIAGAHTLLSTTSMLPMSQTILFSSTAALLGPIGQANYAAANAELNTLASCHQSMGEAFKFSRALSSGNQMIKTLRIVLQNTAIFTLVALSPHLSSWQKCMYGINTTGRDARECKQEGAWCITQHLYIWST